MEAYRHAGRDDVGVVPEIIDRGNDRVDLVYEVTEGAKTTVRQINFVGNTVFGKRQLAAVIKTSATNMLSFLTGGDVYDPDRVAADREQLRLYYRSKGYADASVTSANAEYDPATTGIYADVFDRRRPALSFRRHQRRLQCAGARPRKASPPAAGAGRARCSTATRSTRPTTCSRPNSRSSAFPLRRPRPAPPATPTARRIDVALRRSIRGRAPMSSASTSTATPAPAAM